MRHQRGEALARHFASGDLFLFPSRSETFGNVTLEALASGLPVLAFDYAAAAEVVRHGDSGLLAPVGDTQAYLQLARTVAGDEALLPKVRPGDVIYVSRGETGKDWALRQIPEVQGAFMSMDPFSGRVLAMQGGFSFEESVFNRATQALRQPGSAFKPFVYAAALDAGYTPATGLPELRRAIAQHYQDTYGLTVDPARIVVTAGASAAFSLSTATFPNTTSWLLRTDR